MRKNYLNISKIISYIFAFIYALITALFYSMSNTMYWLFLAFMLISLMLGLYLQSIINRLRETNELNKSDRIALIIITALSVIDCIPLIFNLLAILDDREAKLTVVLNKNYQEKAKVEKKWYQKGCVLTSIISLVLVIIFSIVGNIYETNNGTVSVYDGIITKADSDEYIANNKLPGLDFTITDPDVYISYTYYKPNNATETNNLPVVFVTPGFTRTKATMSQYAIELSRRGAVVFIIDPGSQGGTSHAGYSINSNGEKGEQNSYSYAYSGMGILIPYVYNNVDKFNFIDRDNIAIMGHSAGGGDAAKLAGAIGSATGSYQNSIIKALYISGYIKTSAANVFKNFRCNAALSYAKYDEGSFRYQDENQAFEVIALRFINEVNPTNGAYDNFIVDYEYGKINNGSYRVIHSEDINHCFEMYDKLSIANTINFFRQTLNLNTKLDDFDQVWMGQEISNGLALVSAFALILGLIGVVVTYVPFMKSLKVAANERIENEAQFVDKYSLDESIRLNTNTKLVNKSFGKRLLFWLPTVLTAIIACLDYIPLARLSMDLFPEAAGNIYTYYFPARMMNAVFLWAVVNGAIGLVVWVLTTLIENLYYAIEAKVKHIPSRVDWSKFSGLKVKPLDLLKSIGLAIVLFFVFYGVLQLVYALTHQDFRFMLISASPLNKRFIVTWLIYLAGFYVFYLSNSIRVNLGIAREGFKEYQVMIIGALANSLGLVFMIIINYFVYFKTGTVFYGYYSPTDSNEMWLYINMVFGLIPMMAILPIFNRISYKKTGNVYGGALLWCMIFIMMSLSASISFIPM